MTWPKVSVIIITFNSERTLSRVLDSIASQDYQRKNLEIIVVDGNSKDKTLEIIKKSKLRIKVVQSKYPRDPEACRGVGLMYAKNDIICFVDSDNILPHKLWFKKMVLPFIEHDDIVGTATLRFAYLREDNYLNRYFALIGSADPVGLYLGKADKLSYIDNRWNLYGHVLENKKDYFIIQYEPDHFPTLGSNGFSARRKLLKKAQSDPEHYFHIDVPLDLAYLGYRKYGIVRETIIHDTAADPSIIKYVVKRAKYMMLHYQKRAGDRRYKVFDPGRTKDVYRLFLFVIFSMTFLQPLYVAWKGYKKKKDLAWFVHPFFCFAIALAYEYAIIRRFMSK